MSTTYEMIQSGLDHIQEQFDLVGVKQKEFSERLMTLERKSSASASGAGIGGGHNDLPGGGSRGHGFAGHVIKAFADNAELLAKAPNVRLEIKAAGDALTTSHARTVQSVGVGIPTGAPVGIFNALPKRIIGPISAVEYSRFLALEGAAAKQASEGAAKAAVRPTFSIITETAATLAGFTKVSKQALTDAMELQQAVNSTLTRSIGTALDTFITGGTWGGGAGLLAHATAYTSLVYTGLVDAISEGVASMQVGGFNPDSVALNPADWLSITTARGTANDHYLSGNYTGVLPMSLRGLNVVLSPTVTAGKALVMDSVHIELLVVDQMTIEVGTDADDFSKNLRTILGEIRIIPCYRAVGAARLITPKAA